MFYTIKEALKIINRSEITLRRKIKQRINLDHDQLIRERVGTQYTYKIAKEWLEKHFNTSNDQVKDHGHDDDQTLINLFDQLKEKDKQIEKLSQLLEREQIISREYQQKFLLLEGHKESKLKRLITFFKR